MPHIHTEPGQHDQAASFYIIRTDGPKPRVALHMHKRMHRLTMFGGHVELDETPWQTVLHELTEETGYQPEQLKILQPYYRITHVTGATLHPQPIIHLTGNYPGNPVPHYHTDVVYAFTTAQDPVGQPGEDESTDIRWYTLNQLDTIPENQVIQAWREVAQHILTHHLTEWEQLPLNTFKS